MRHIHPDSVMIACTALSMTFGRSWNPCFIQDHVFSIITQDVMTHVFIIIHGNQNPMTSHNLYPCASYKSNVSCLNVKHPQTKAPIQWYKQMIRYLRNNGNIMCVKHTTKLSKYKNTFGVSKSQHWKLHSDRINVIVLHFKHIFLVSFHTHIVKITVHIWMHAWVLNTVRVTVRQVYCITLLCQLLEKDMTPKVTQFVYNKPVCDAHNITRSYHHQSGHSSHEPWSRMLSPCY